VATLPTLEDVAYASCGSVLDRKSLPLFMTDDKGGLREAANELKAMLPVVDCEARTISPPTAASSLTCSGRGVAWTIQA
jgi:hypothetical protein